VEWYRANILQNPPKIRLRGTTHSSICISVFAALNVTPLSRRFELAAVFANISKGSRKVATTSPSSQVQFDSRKFRRRRFSPGSCATEAVRHDAIDPPDAAVQASGQLVALPDTRNRDGNETFQLPCRPLESLIDADAADLPDSDVRPAMIPDAAAFTLARAMSRTLPGSTMPVQPLPLRHKRPAPSGRSWSQKPATSRRARPDNAVRPAVAPDARVAALVCDSRRPARQRCGCAAIHY
jgi:hypothetical protein